MNIQLAGPAQAPSAPPAQSRLSGGGGASGFRRPAPTRGGAPRGGGRGGRGGARGGARPAGQTKPEKSAADLDADLDAYTAKMQTD